MKYYVADFETTTNSADCHVWAYAICEVGNDKKENVIVGTSIDVVSPKRPSVSR